MLTAPTLRGDLQISSQATGTDTIFVVKDPISRRFFRFGGAEHTIARQFDGTTDFSTICERLEQQGLSTTEEVVREFARQLDRLGLLESPDRPAAGPHRSRAAGSLLYIRLKAFDPDRLLDRLVVRVRFFFTSWFVALSLAALATALVILVADWHEIIRDLSGLYRFDALLLAWFTVLLVTTLHEFAHALTCKHFGGEVHEMGFLLIYFQPAFYCNVSDAWLFPEKSKRLWVTFAGAYFETFLWSLATITWRVVEPGTWLSFVAMIVMATSGIKSIFNLNPLIKLDGYYLLSDYLEVPNLRQRSMAYLKSLVRRLWTSTTAVLPASPRERRIYVTYGLLAAAYSWWLLGIIGVHFGGALIERYQAYGFLACTALVMAIFQGPLSRAADRVPAAWRSKPVEWLRLRRPTGKAALLIVVLAVLLFGRWELTVTGAFTVLPIRNADVRAPVDGVIESVYVDEGDAVKEGDLLARLSERDYQAELAKVEAEIAERRAVLRMMQAGPRSEELDLARGEIRTAQTRQDHARQRLAEAEKIHAARVATADAARKAAVQRLEFARVNLGRMNELFSRGLTSRKELDESQQQVSLRDQELAVAQAEFQVVSADNFAELRQSLAVNEKQVQEANERLKLLRAGSRAESIEATEAEVARLQTQHQFLGDQLRRTTIRSPASGIVTTPKFKDKIGEHVKQGDLIGKVFELHRVTPEALVPEKDIADVRPGQRVALKARAYPDRQFDGTVVAIAPTAIDQTDLGRKVFRVKIDVDAPSDSLKPEMTGNVKILCGPRPIWRLLTRRVLRYVRVEFWSWW